MNLKSYDIIVEIDSAQGGKKREERTNVQAPNEKMLQMIFSATGERVVQILRERDGDKIIDRSGNPPQQQIQQDNQPTPMTNTSNPVQAMSIGQPVKEKMVVKVVSEPKFYKIGDIEIKEQDGKIFQKQWVSLDMNEVNNFRIVSDSNNRIVPMNGKHIEMRKWIAVSSSDDEEHNENKNEKELLNG